MRVACRVCVYFSNDNAARNNFNIYMLRDLYLAFSAGKILIH